MDPPKTKSDSYNWLRDETRKDETVLNHIKAENDYCNNEMSHLKPLQDELYVEMLSHLKETDEDMPYPYGDHSYYSKTIKGKSYRIHCRKPLSADASKGEQIILDENILAENQEYVDVNTVATSPDHTLLAYSVDYDGSETYKVTVKNLATGEVLLDVIEDISGDITWGNDNTSLFYTKMDSEHRPNRLYMHVLGTSQEEDICYFQEDDSRYNLGVGKSASDRFLFIESESKETSEVFAVDLMGVKGGVAHKAAIESRVCLHPREEGMRYSADHHDEALYIITNKDNAKNNKLMKISLKEVNTRSCNSRDWKEVRAYDPKVQIDELLPFKDYFAVFGREDGLPRVWLMNANEEDWRRIEFPEVTYSVWGGANYVYTSDVLRLGYSSLISPKLTVEYNMKTMKKNILKTQEIPDYNPDLYDTKRIYCTSRDGRQIPISLVYKKSVFGESKSVGGNVPVPVKSLPLLLYGYGSYGMCIDPSFDYKRTSLLDRGVVYAIAHIRGGGEMGRYWYEDEGKYLTKQNTFNDFADCASYLTTIGLTAADKTAIVGRSAGGLLIGGMCNQYPELFKVGVADVPFVDVINSMSDPTIPLTVTEWEEWGNPNEEKFFSCMEAYSPYDNVVAQRYPSLLVTAGLNDPRVAYWEPAKWVAKLRELKLDDNKLLFKTDLSSGHFSASDRYKYLKETAFEYSFILEQITEVK